MVFSPSEFRSFPLEKKERINHNTSLFRFTLPEKSQVAGLPVASCVMFRFVDKDGKEVIRPYTPTSNEEAEGHIDFVIKNYPQGNMSSHVHALNIGDTIDIKGPFVKYDWNTKAVQNAAFVLGGTGITPGIFNEKNATDTKVVVIFANLTEEDILFKEELDTLAKNYPDRFHITYVLEKAPENWKHAGFITADLLKQVVPGPETESFITFVCGPPPFMEAISGDKNPDKSQGTLRGYFKELGYNQENILKL
ncbi:hypothetical protein K501DRAFT_295053 [Backusella circina FSU 941]|nr:hypothetical protein K501DRAFT_295053 [Backusella circina FSU 941]